MKILKRYNYRCRSMPATLGTILYHLEGDDFFFNEEYQRPYVWGDKERTEFMDNLFSAKPIGAFSVIEIDKSKPTEWIEVVDGRQRVTTLKMFFNNEFKYNGYYWDDLCHIEKRYIKDISFPMLYLEMVDGSIVPDNLKLEYFYGVNFSGVPQSEEHRLKILNMMNKG